MKHITIKRVLFVFYDKQDKVVGNVKDQHLICILGDDGFFVETIKRNKNLHFLIPTHFKQHAEMKN